MRLRPGAVLALSAVVGLPLRAQSAESARTHCRLPDTSPMCRHWTLFEASLLGWAAGTRHVPYNDIPLIEANAPRATEADFGSQFAFTLGGMTNLESGVAIGPTISAGLEQQYRMVFRPEMRSRLWLSDDASVDVMAGLFITRVLNDQNQIRGLNGPSAAVSLNVAGISAIARQDISTGHAHRASATYLGVAAGRGVNPTIVIAGVVVAIFSGMGSGR